MRRAKQIFWKTVKPPLSDKSLNSDKIHLNENEELINSESKTDEKLSNLFSNTNSKKLKNSRQKKSSRKCSVKKMFLEIAQNSLENTCARVSFLIKSQLQIKKKMYLL